jgi:hypothetical protein
VLYSSQDHLKTGTRDLEHPVLVGAENTHKSAIYFIVLNKSCLPRFELKTSIYDTMFGYYAATSSPKSLS